MKRERERTIITCNTAMTEPLARHKQDETTHHKADIKQNIKKI